MNAEEVTAQLKIDVHKKIEELNFAEYQGDILGMVAIVINKNGQLQTMQAFSSMQAPHIYTAAGLLQRQIEGMLSVSAEEMKPRE